MARFDVYTLRRTSSRTVYAVYDNIDGAPVHYVKPGTDRPPVTTTDIRKARELANALASEDTARIAGAVISCGVSQSAAWRLGYSYGRGL